MRITVLAKSLIIALPLVILAGCASTGDQDSQAEAERASQAKEQARMEQTAQAEARRQQDAEASAASEAAKIEAKKRENTLRQSRLFYFDFDKSLLKSTYKAVLAAHARHLIAHPDYKIRLEGHADERGTREYNLALGERRAKAVENQLRIMGVSHRQIDVISFGEEKPVEFGKGEVFYSKNRRVELLYSQ